MTREEVLQKVNAYCSEKNYTTATLTDDFKSKFADHFIKLNPDADIADATVQGSLQFALNSAFNSASTIAALKVNEFTTKENEYKAHIDALNKKLGIQVPPTPPTPPAIPEEIQKQLDELKQFKTSEALTARKKEVIAKAKEGIRKDLHKSFETFAVPSHLPRQHRRHQAIATEGDGTEGRGVYL